MEVFLTLLGGALGLVGAFVGVWLANYYNTRAYLRQKKEETTIALYTEFNSEAMILSRIRASDILTKNSKKDQPLTLTELSRVLDQEDWYHISRVLSFYEKLGIYLQANYLDTTLTQRLLGKRFIHWYEKLIQELLSEKDRAQLERNQPIQYTYNWLKTHREEIIQTASYSEE